MTGYGSIHILAPSVKITTVAKEQSHKSYWKYSVKLFSGIIIMALHIIIKEYSYRFGT